MERITPLWLPNEKECLLSILENLVYEGLLATREKLGYSTVCLIDTNFWTNIGLEFDRVPHEPELMGMITDFSRARQPSWIMRDRLGSLPALMSGSITSKVAPSMPISTNFFLAAALLLIYLLNITDSP